MPLEVVEGREGNGSWDVRCRNVAVCRVTISQPSFANSAGSLLCGYSGALSAPLVDGGGGRRWKAGVSVSLISTLADDPHYEVPRDLKRHVFLVQPEIPLTSLTITRNDVFILGVVSDINNTEVLRTRDLGTR